VINTADVAEPSKVMFGRPAAMSDNRAWLSDTFGTSSAIFDRMA